MSKRFTESDLNEETLTKLDLIVEHYGYRDREEAIKALVTEQINKGMGEMKGGAKLRQTLNLTSVLRKDDR